jgi:hypothetical protein
MGLVVETGVSGYVTYSGVGTNKPRHSPGNQRAVAEETRRDAVEALEHAAELDAMHPGLPSHLLDQKLLRSFSDRLPRALQPIRWITARGRQIDAAPEQIVQEFLTPGSPDVTCEQPHQPRD